MYSHFEARIQVIVIPVLAENRHLTSFKNNCHDLRVEGMTPEMKVVGLNPVGGEILYQSSQCCSINYSGNEPRRQVLMNLSCNNLNLTQENI